MRREVTVELSSQGFWKTGIRSDVCQVMMLLRTQSCLYLSFHSFLALPFSYFREVATEHTISQLNGTPNINCFVSFGFCFCSQFWCCLVRFCGCAHPHAPWQRGGDAPAQLQPTWRCSWKERLQQLCRQTPEGRVYGRYRPVDSRCRELKVLMNRVSINVTFEPNESIFSLDELYRGTCQMYMPDSPISVQFFCRPCGGIYTRSEVPQHSICFDSSLAFLL